ncbi:zinc finger, CCHC-type containing protein [Tanacetum coccineum]
MIIRRTREVLDVVLIITPSYELGFRRLNSSRVQNEKIYNLAKDVAVTTSHVIGDAITKALENQLLSVSLLICLGKHDCVERIPSDSSDLNGATRNTTHLRLFWFSLRDQAINWVDRLPTRSISTWDDLTACFLAQFFPPERTAKLRNYILMFQQYQSESLYDAWNHFKDLLQKVPNHGLDLWLQVQIFYDHVDYTTQMAIDYAEGERLRKLRPKEAWKIIEDLA